MPIITSVDIQARNPNRCNLSVDGKYRLSLAISQVAELKLKPGRELTDDELATIEGESQFGKLYERALEYCLSRPHSGREVRDYLARKQRDRVSRARNGQLKKIPGVAEAITERVYARLRERGYIDDQKFADWWVENRNQRKGASRRKLEQELYAKGIDRSLIDRALATTERDERSELAKMIERKAKRYSDPNKLKQYLLRQGFSYDDIDAELSSDD